MSFVFDLPTTGSFNFTRCLVASSPSSENTRFLAQATLLRNQVRTSLKECRRTDEAAKNWPGVLKSVQEYLPHAFTIKARLESDDLLFKQEASYNWRPVLSENKLAKSRRVSMASVEFEVAFCLLTYGLCLANMATRLVATLGDYERLRTTSESERQRLDEQLNSAADLLCRASGLFDYLSCVFIAKWEETVSEDLKLRPLDLTRDVTSALASLCMADAERLAIRKLLSKSYADALVSPGPPLPRSHPSPTLLAKLQLNVLALYERARSSYKASTSSNRELSPEFRKYLTTGRTVNGGLSYKWLGVEAGEGSSNKIGEALAWLHLARTEILSVKPKAPTIGFGKKGIAAKKERKTRLDMELETIEAFTKVYKQLNDTVSFQPIPDATSLLAKVPGGRSALVSKPYTPPQAVLASTNLALNEQVERMNLNESDSEDDSDAPQETAGTGSSEYALQGAYY